VQRSSWFRSSKLDLKILILVIILCSAPQAGLRAWGQAPPGSPSGQQGVQPQAASPGRAAPEAAVRPDEVVLTIGDSKITAAEFEALARNLPPEVASVLPSMGKKGFAERYANLFGLAKEGEKRKVDQSEVFRQMMAFQRLMLLGQLTLNEVATSTGEVSPDEVNSYYTAHQPDFQQVKLRGIYIPFGTEAEAGASEAAPGSQAKAKPPANQAGKPKLTEAEARTKAESLRQRIRAGESMATLAKKESDHATAAKGGDFDFVRRGQFAPQIDSVIFGLELQQVSDPVKDRFGYFIFQVEEKRAQPVQEVRTVIENNLRQQKLGETLSKIQADNPVSLNPRYFSEPAPAAPSMPPGPANK